MSLTRVGGDLASVASSSPELRDQSKPPATTPATNTADVTTTTPATTARLVRIATTPMATRVRLAVRLLHLRRRPIRVGDHVAVPDRRVPAVRHVVDERDGCVVA